MNAKLKKLLAEGMLDNGPLEKITVKKAVTPAASRGTVQAANGERRACSMVGADRSTVRYRHWCDDDAAIGVTTMPWSARG